MPCLRDYITTEKRLIIRILNYKRKEFCKYSDIQLNGGLKPLGMAAFAAQPEAVVFFIERYGDGLSRYPY